MPKGMRAFFSRLFGRDTGDFSRFADVNEHFADGDPVVDWDRVGEVAAVFADSTPLEALKAIYGDKLEVPA